MSKFNIEDNHFWRGLLSRTLLVLVTVAIIVWFLPRNSGPQFRYDVGKPWMYGSFITKFDFPIYKTDEAIKAERDSLADEFEPYYAYAADVEKEKIDEFMSDFKNGIPGLSYDYVRIIADRLHRIYQAGIMAAPEYSEINKDSTNMVRIISGKQASSLMINCIYSTIGAYEQLLNDEKLAPQRAVLQKCNLNNYITPNLIYDKERSETEMNDLMAGIPLASGMVLSGQKIIDRGEIVDDYAFRVLNSFEKEMQRRSANSSEITSTILGQTLFVAILIILFTLYLVLYRKEYFQKPRNTTMLYVLITLFPILVSLMMKHAFLSVYILPFALVPIFVRVFMDARTAFISLVTMVLLCAAAVKYQYEFIIIQITSGLVAIYSLGELSQRAQLFRTAVLVTLTSAAVYLALQLMQDNSIFTMDHSIYIYFIMNGVLLLFAYPLMYLIEKAFGFISNVTLIELSNTSKDPLRKLSETAPGTFQHSIMVSNLAAQIANKIGANTQLVRTGALYHDIGKMEDPAYFTENQVGVNPLEKLPRPEAAQMVINHVTEGLKLGEKYDLPRIITDFIMTHHGEGKTKYFYISYKNEHPDEPIDDTLFAYPGPNPFTREQAILMMADSVEAASRSLPEYTEESISNLVNKIIDTQVEEGYFTDCPITFRDISTTKQVLINRLKSIYHTRISYPELKK
ncbi:MAG: HDIG domain-containing protein [Prevotella sp.]|nr:HDIG domain-containing protein [Prevotella sp.]